MKLIFLLIASSTLIPVLMAANDRIKRMMEMFNSNPEGRAMIRETVLKGSFESIKSEIERASHSELNAVNEEGMNVAHIAAALGQINVLELLYEKKKNLIFAENNVGHQAIHVAAKCGQADVAKFLVTRANVAVDVKSGGKKMTSLQLAAESGCVGVIQALVELKADIDASDNEGILTPLAYAAAGGHFEATKTLLDLGANKEKLIPFKKSVLYSGVTPLTIAVHTLNVELAELLLTREAQTIFGNNTVLHYLAHAPPVRDGGKKVEAMLDMLIEKQMYRGPDTNTGVRPERLGHGKRNILQYAICRKNYDVFDVLIRKINEERRSGDKNGFWTKLLDNEGTDGLNALGVAVIHRDTKMSSALMRAEAMRVGAANFYMDEKNAENIIWSMEIEVKGRDILQWVRQRRPEKFPSFCETLLKKYEETWADMPQSIALNLSSIFPWYKSHGVYPFYLALKSYYPKHLLRYKQGENKELAQELSEEYRSGKEKREEYLENEEGRIKLLELWKENEYLMENRIKFLNLLKEICVWRPEIEEDAMILAQLSTKFEFNSEDVKAFFSEDGKERND